MGKCCGNCGYELRENLRFCPQCGKLVARENKEEPQDSNKEDKLGATERIMAPLAIVRKHDQSSPELLLTAASALYYGKMTKTLLKTEAEYIVDLPEEWQKEIMEDLEALEQKKDIADILK